jgi:hypothetical protein
MEEKTMENNTEKTTIAMELVDGAQEETTEVTELQKVEEEKPKGPIGKFVRWATTPVRYVWNKAKKSPVVAGLGGAALGAAGGWAAKGLYDSLKQKKNGNFIPADPIEVSDDGESYVETGTSYESTED